MSEDTAKNETVEKELELVEDIFFPNNGKLDPKDPVEGAIINLSGLMITLNDLISKIGLSKDPKIREELRITHELAAAKFCMVRELLEHVRVEKKTEVDSEAS